MRALFHRLFADPVATSLIRRVRAGAERAHRAGSDVIVFGWVVLTWVGVFPSR